MFLIREIADAILCIVTVPVMRPDDMRLIGSPTLSVERAEDVCMTVGTTVTVDMRADCRVSMTADDWCACTMDCNVGLWTTGHARRSKTKCGIPANTLSAPTSSQPHAYVDRGVLENPQNSGRMLTLPSPLLTFRYPMPMFLARWYRLCRIASKSLLGSQPTY